MKKHDQKNLRRRGFIALYLLPPLIIYVVFMVYPFIQSFCTSFYKWNGISKDKLFVGFDNYIRLFSDPVILTALKNNAFILLWCTLITFVISITFAVILTRKKYRSSTFFKIVFFLPYVLSLSVVSIIWKFIYDPSFGILNDILTRLGLEQWIHLWLGDKTVIMGALTVPLIWVNIGFYMVVFISGILDIPPELFEAASLDGAGEIQQFFHVTLPQIWEVVRVSLVFFVVTAFNYSFELVYIITKGGPNRASELLTTYLYEKAFRTSEFGYASAIGTVLFLLVFVFVFFVLRATRRNEE